MKRSRLARFERSARLLNAGLAMGALAFGGAGCAATPAAHYADGIELRAQSGPLDGLGFMAGSWVGVGISAGIEEHWMAPAGDTMLGMARVTEDGATQGWEQLRIEAHGGTLVLHANLPEATSTPLPAVARSVDRIEFANDVHNPTVKIVYAAGPRGTLVATIERFNDGLLERVKLRFERAQVQRGRRSGLDARESARDQ